MHTPVLQFFYLGDQLGEYYWALVASHTCTAVLHSGKQRVLICQ
jgi:hypothetical protein